MKTITAQDSVTGRTITFQWYEPTPPTQEDLAVIFKDAENQVKNQQQKMANKWVSQVPLSPQPEPKLQGATALQQGGEVSPFVKKLAETKLPEQIIATAYGAGKGMFNIPQILAGKEASKEAEKIAREHPVASFGGELAGSLLPLSLVSDLTKPMIPALMKVYRETPTLARFIPRAIQSATTFSAYNLLSEASKQLQQGTFQPDKLVDEMGKGYTFGLGVGGLGGVANTAGRIISSGAFAGGMTALNEKIQQGQVNPKDVLFNTALVAGFTAINAPKISKDIRVQILQQLRTATRERLLQENPLLSPQRADEAARAFVGAFHHETFIREGRLPTLKEIEDFTQAIAQGWKIYVEAPTHTPAEDIIKPDIIRTIAPYFGVSEPQRPSITTPPVEEASGIIKPPIKPLPVFQPPQPQAPEVKTPETIEIPPTQEDLQKIREFENKGIRREFEEAKEKIIEREKQQAPSLYAYLKGRIRANSVKPAGYSLKELAEEGIHPYFWTKKPNGVSLDEVAEDLVNNHEIPPPPPNKYAVDHLIDLLIKERKGDIVFYEAQERLADVMLRAEEEALKQLEAKYGRQRIAEAIGETFEDIQKNIENEVNGETAKDPLQARENLNQDIINDDELQMALEYYSKGEEIPDIYKEELKKRGLITGGKAVPLIKEWLPGFEPGIFKTEPKAEVEQEPVVSKQEVKPEVPPELEPLAKKYPIEIKTQEEIAKGFIPEAEASYKTFKPLNKLPKWALEEVFGEVPDKLTVYHAGEFEVGKPIFVSTDLKYAREFAKKGERIYKFEDVPISELRAYGEGRIIGRNRFTGTEGVELIFKPSQYFYNQAKGIKEVKSEIPPEQKIIPATKGIPEVKPETEVKPEEAPLPPEQTPSVAQEVEKAVKPYTSLEKGLQQLSEAQKQEYLEAVKEIKKSSKVPYDIKVEADKVAYELLFTPQKNWSIETRKLHNLLTAPIIEEPLTEYTKEGITISNEKQTERIEKENRGSTATTGDLYAGRKLHTAKILSEFQTPETVAEEPNIQVLQIANTLAPIRKLGKEASFVVYVKDNKIQEIRAHTKGLIASSLASSTGITAPAIKLKSNKIYFVHNHPSGTPRPSDEDLYTMKKIKQIADKINIPVEGVIIAGTKGVWIDPVNLEHTVFNIPPIPKKGKMPVVDYYQKTPQVPEKTYHSPDRIIEYLKNKGDGILFLDTQYANPIFKPLRPNKIIEDILDTLANTGSFYIVFKLNKLNPYKQRKIREAVDLLSGVPEAQVVDLIVDNFSMPTIVGINPEETLEKSAGVKEPEGEGFLKQGISDKEYNAIIQVAKQKQLSDQQIKRLLDIYTGRKKLDDLDTEEAYKFLDILSGVALGKGGQPPKIPKTDTAMPIDYFSKEIKEPTVLAKMFLEPWFIFKRCGIWDEVGKPLYNAEETRVDETTKKAYIVENWMRDAFSGVPRRDRQEINRLMFKYVDGTIKPEDLVKLNEGQKAICEEWKRMAEEYADKLGIPYDKRQPNYIPHIIEETIRMAIQDGQFPDELYPLIAEYVHTKEVFDPFLQKRLGFPVIKEDFFGAVWAYIRYAEKKLAYDPALEQVNPYINPAEGKQLLPPRLRRYVEEFINHAFLRRPFAHEIELNKDINKVLGKVLPQKKIKLPEEIAKQIGKDYVVVDRVINKPADKLISGAIQADYASLIALNIRTTIVNLTQPVLAWGKLEGLPHKTAMDMLYGYYKVATTIFSPKNWEKFREIGLLPQTEHILEETGDAARISRAIRDIAFVNMQVSEYINRVSTAYAGAKNKMRRGDFEELLTIDDGLRKKTEWLDKAFSDLINYQYGRLYRPLYSLTPMGRIMYHLNSFNLKTLQLGLEELDKLKVKELPKDFVKNPVKTLKDVATDERGELIRTLMYMWLVGLLMANIFRLKRKTMMLGKGGFFSVNPSENRILRLLVATITFNIPEQKRILKQMYPFYGATTRIKRIQEEGISGVLSTGKPQKREDTLLPDVSLPDISLPKLELPKQGGLE